MDNLPQWRKGGSNPAFPRRRPTLQKAGLGRHGMWKTASIWKKLGGAVPSPSRGPWRSSCAVVAYLRVPTGRLFPSREQGTATALAQGATWVSAFL